jgi:hypothetical protein
MTNTTQKQAKRSIKVNAYGNWVGYVGRVRSEEFGDDVDTAEIWVKTDLNFFESRDAALAEKWSK